MKGFVLSVVMALLPLSAQADAKEAVRDITKGIVKFTKEVSSGISEGMNEGRKATEGADGALVVTDFDGMSKHVKVELIRVHPAQGSKITTAVLGFKNSEEKPVRLAGLRGQGSLLAVDDEGYSHRVTNSFDNPNEITVPAGAAIQQPFEFEGEAEKVVEIRFWGHAYDAKGKIQRAEKQ